MAAYTEGFTDTSQPGRDHLGAMISKVIAARKFAREEREQAEAKAKKAGYDSLDELGVEKGFFFKAALKSKFGGSYISGKKKDIQQTVDRVKLLKNPKAQFWNFVDNRDADGKEIKKLSEIERFRKQFDNYNFQSAKRPPEKVESSEEMIPDTAEETASSASGTGKSRVSREDILTAVSAIASSLEQTAQSINNTLGETKDIASGVQAIKTDVVTQLSERTDTIEAKLDAIAAAINAQTALQKQTIDNNQGAENMGGAKPVKNAADSFDTNDPFLEGNQSEEIDTDTDNIPDQKPPEAETGGIISGPDSGYLAKLHGDEMVVPLDNNYTQGEPSAMDGKVRPVPETSAITSKPQSFEQGTSNLGSKVGFTKLNLGMASKSSSDSDAMSQPLMDAMSLPMMVAGGTVLSSVTNLMNQLGPESDSFAGEIAKVARPIADVFGLPNSLANKVTGQTSGKGDSDTKNKDKTEAKKRGFFSNLFEKLKKVSGGAGNRGGGGPSTTNSGGGTNSSASQQEVADVMGSEFEAQGLSEEGAKLALAEIGRENSLSRSLILGTHDDGGKTAYGAVSWQGGREKVLFDELKARGIDPTVDGLAGSGDEGLRANAAAMVKEIAARGHTELLDLLKKPNLTDAEKDKVRQLFKDQYFVYNKGISIQRSRDWYETVGKMSQTPPSSTEDDIIDSGDSAESMIPTDSQLITQTFGAKTGERLYFMHNGKLHNAYKTSKGFALFYNRMPIDTSNGKNAAVLKSFIKEGKKRSGISSPTAPETPGQTQAALQKPNKNTGASGATQVAMLNTSAAQKSAGTDKPPTAEDTVVREPASTGLPNYYAVHQIGQG